MKRVLYIFVSVLLFASCTGEDLSPDHPPGVSDYTGSWNVQEDCSKSGYSVEISADYSDSTKVYISNFAQLGYDMQVHANISEDLITVLKQTVDGTEVQGNGTLSGDKITWSYSLNDGADLIQCSAIYTRSQ